MFSEGVPLVFVVVIVITLFWFLPLLPHGPISQYSFSVINTFNCNSKICLLKGLSNSVIPMSLSPKSTLFDFRYLLPIVSLYFCIFSFYFYMVSILCVRHVWLTLISIYSMYHLSNSFYMSHFTFLLTFMTINSITYIFCFVLSFWSCIIHEGFLFFSFRKNFISEPIRLTLFYTKTL